MQMMGTLLPLMVLIRSATPPLSPADMPSTSSMIRQICTANNLTSDQKQKTLISFPTSLMLYRAACNNQSRSSSCSLCLLCRGFWLPADRPGGLTLILLPWASTPIAALVASSLTTLDFLPPIPATILESALLRVSLALTSTGVYPSSLQTGPIR